MDEGRSNSEEFRKMRRFKQQVSEEECRKILREEKRGTLAVHGENGYPYAVPVNFYYDEASGKIYIHGAKAGHKYDALKKDPKACFTVCNQGFQKPGDWVYNATSVVCFCRVRFVDSVSEKELAEDMCRKIGLKYYPDAEDVEEELRKAFSRV